MLSLVCCSTRAIGQYLYDGGLKEISCVDKTGSILRLTEYSKDELETIIYVFLIYYLLGRGSPMPIFNEALSNITIDDEGNVGITKDSFRNADFFIVFSFRGCYSLESTS